MSTVIEFWNRHPIWMVAVGVVAGVIGVVVARVVF